MHRIHHSQDMKEGNSNFGNVFPWWDMLFKTYAHKDEENLNQLEFGINVKESPNSNSIKSLLMNPFI